MLFRSLHGPVWGNQRSLTTGSGAWPLTIIVLRSSCLAGLSIGRAPVEALRPPMNFLMRLLVGLGIQIHESERRGRKARDLQSSSHIIEHYWFWTGWSLSKIRLGHKKDDYASLPCRRFCANSLPSI